MPHIAGFRGVIAAPQGAPARDPGRAVYRYHQTFAGPGGRAFTRKSFFCAVRLSPWTEGMVRPHEATTQAQRDAALAQLRATGVQHDAVLCGVRDQASEVDRLFRKTESAKPTLELTTPDGVKHALWRAQDAELMGKLRNYFTPKKLHLLDGHDRYEAALGYQTELTAKRSLTMYAAANYALASVVTMEDAGLVAAARHRILRGGEGQAPIQSDAVIAAARKHFLVDKLAGAATDLPKLSAALADTVAHQPALIVVFAGEADAWKLTLSPDVSPVNEGVAVDRAIAKLDPVVVEHLFLARTMPGVQVTSDPDATRALAALGQGAAAAVIVRPLSVEQIAHVDELGQLLPPHSTAFYPPIAPGLVSFVVDPDEDLQ